MVVEVAVEEVVVVAEAGAADNALAAAAALTFTGGGSNITWLKREALDALLVAVVAAELPKYAACFCVCVCFCFDGALGASVAALGAAWRLSKESSFAATAAATAAA